MRILSESIDFIMPSTEGLFALWILAAPARSKSLQQDRKSVRKDQALHLETLEITHYHYGMSQDYVKHARTTAAGTGGEATPAFPAQDLPGIPARMGTNGYEGIHVALAPLCGITDWIYRQICLRHGADLVFTEMISSDALSRKTGETRAMRRLNNNEDRLVMQIFGSEPRRMGEAAEILSSMNPRFIDLNFGCPARKVVKGNGGAALLRDVPLLERVCRAVVKKSRVPVSAKIRTGWDKSTLQEACGIARAIESAGVSALTVHARTRMQAFAGEAEWEYIQAVKEAVSIPVVGNGDVCCADDYFAMREQTGCDAVMIGRAAIGNPWIFSEIKQRISGIPVNPPTPRERISLLKNHVRESIADLGEPLGIIVMRRVIAAYLKHLAGARELRGKILRLENLHEIEAVLDQHMEANGW
jgi:tRNA-dihydrouridine synthase B